jgi:phosphoribosyl-ATP pyrophosphohydrolase
MNTFAAIEMEVVRWGEARGIVQNGTPMGQAAKTLEEVAELVSAVNRNDLDDVVDAVGDIMVCLTMLCAIYDLNLTDCYKAAYNEIKDRKGYLREDGVFVKTESPHLVASKD